MTSTATSHPTMAGEPLLQVRELTQEFYVPGRAASVTRRNRFQAVAGVSFEVGHQETVGIVGETGCGKSTLARSIVQLPKPKSGEVLLSGTDLTRLGREQLRLARRNIQMVWQDPYSSLDPRWKILDQITEPLRIHEIGTVAERERRATELLGLVGLDPNRVSTRRPRALSGGECQRVVVARALALEPKLLILDEPVSSMDVSIQAQVLNLLETLRRELGLSYVFISHDLSIVKHVSDRVIVMYLGKFCEIAPAEKMYLSPYHPYSAELIASIPDPRLRGDRRLRAVHHGEIASPANPPSGCRFRTRCPNAQTLCAEVEPELRSVAPGHLVACHFPLLPVASVGSALSGLSATAGPDGTATETTTAS